MEFIIVSKFDNLLTTIYLSSILQWRIERKNKKIYTFAFKILLLIHKMLNRLFALFFLIIFSPIFLLIFLVLIGQGKVFFRQKRIGYQEKVFIVYKFKTMNDQKDSEGKLLPDEKRLSKVGKFLRKTSLDELPQLWNVLKGNMNFVGPRPLLVEYLLLYNQKQKLRHHVKPGITGLAQVKGRNSISWQKRLAIDVWYVKNRSFCLDCKIILMTIKNIFLKADGEEIMPKFEGN